jgi:hypothetical protein
MPADGHSAQSSLIDVLDRVLDKGVVIDAYVHVSLVGIGLVDVEARIVVASVTTYLKYSDQVGNTTLAARPAVTPHLQGAEALASRAVGERAIEARRN